MQFKSEKFSIRVQDGLKYNSIIYTIYYFLFTDFFSYLPFLDEINSNIQKYEYQVIQNFIKTSVLNSLVSKNVHIIVMDIYVDNTKFFQKKYSFTTENIDSLNTNEERGLFILEKIFDSLNIFKEDQTQKNKNQFFYDLVFGKNNKNIFDCPIIVQKRAVLNQTVPIVTKKYYSNPLDSFNQVNFFIDQIQAEQSVQESSFTVPVSEDNNNIYSDLKYFNYYFFDAEYLSLLIDKGFNFNSAFHFERFVSFDFDFKNFISKVKEAQNLSAPTPTAFGNVNFENFYYSSLNLSLFLPNENGIIENIVVNPEYFKKAFPTEILSNVQQITDKYNIILDYLPLFIRNIKCGLRLVYKNNPEQESKEKVKYSSEINKLSNKEINYFLQKDESSLYKKASSYSNIDSKICKKTFSELEYNIVKNKGYIIFKQLFDENTGKFFDNFRQTWIPIVSIYSDKVLNSSATSEFNNIKEIHDYINDSKSEVLEELKKKMFESEQFQFVYKKLIPVEALLLLQKIDFASENQNFLNFSLQQEPPSSDSVVISKNLKNSMENFINISLKDDKEY